MWFEKYPGILVDRVHKVTEGLVDDEQGGDVCVDQIFTLKQIGEKKCRAYWGFMEKAYDRIN